MSNKQTDVIVRDVEFKRCARKIKGAVNEICLVYDEFAKIIEGITTDGIKDEYITSVLITAQASVSSATYTLKNTVEDIETDTKSFIEQLDEKDEYFY